MSPGGLHRCTEQCRDPDLEQQQRAAGCPAVEIQCPVCHGQDEACQECGGEGKVPIWGCPAATVRREHYDAVLAVSLMQQGGVLPVAGGLTDQAGTFVEALPLLMREIAHHQHAHAEQARREAERAAQSRRR